MTIPSAPNGWFDYCYFVLSDGALAVLRTDRDINAEWRAWWGKAQSGGYGRRAPDLWNGKAHLAIVVDDGDSKALDVPLVRNPLVDRFPDGRWLIAGNTAKRGEANALVLTAEGNLSHSFHIGDGIEHVRCAPDGTIWVGYFDEGIFGGGLGWGGIVNFTERGESLWSYNDDNRETQSLNSDCYALTLSGNEVWSCFYADFPIVRIAEGRETLWTNGVSGAKALAVDGSFVLLAGGYGADAKRLALLKLVDGEARLLGSYNLPELENAALISGRSSVLDVVRDGTWTRISIAEARSHLRV